MSVGTNAIRLADRAASAYATGDCLIAERQWRAFTSGSRLITRAKLIIGCSIPVMGDGSAGTKRPQRKFERLFLCEKMLSKALEDVGGPIFPGAHRRSTATNAYNNAHLIDEAYCRASVQHRRGLCLRQRPLQSSRGCWGELQCQVVAGLNGYIDTRRSIRGDEQSKAARDKMGQVMSSLQIRNRFYY